MKLYRIGLKIELSSHSTEMEQMRQQMTEMLAVMEAVISTKLGDTDTYYAKMEASWACLLIEMKEDIKANQEKMATMLEDKLDADLAKAKMDANRKEMKEDNSEKFEIP
jgi:hypothetical protein